MTKEEIERIVEDFAKSAIRAEKAGFEGEKLPCYRTEKLVTNESYKYRSIT